MLVNTNIFLILESRKYFFLGKKILFKPRNPNPRQGLGAGQKEGQ
jgi:hypothetical protein